MRTKKEAKLTLATLGKLATNAIDDEDAAAELRAHVLANVETYAALLGVSSAKLGAGVEEVAGDRRRDLGRCVVQAIKDRNARLREAAGVARDREASYAADSATAGATFTGEIGVVELDAGLVRAALACNEPRVRVTLTSGGVGVDVNGRILRGILAVRPDARVFVHTLELPEKRVVSAESPWMGTRPLRVTWECGSCRGGMNLAAQGVSPDDVHVRVIHVPDPFAPFAVREEVAAANDVEEAQAAE
jgi:hypothetical protein